MWKQYGEWSNDAPWTEEFKRLDLCGGSGRFISENGQDMMEIFLPDGFMVDVGYIEEDKCWVVTVAKTEDWHAFHMEQTVSDRARLYAAIQSAVYRAASAKPLRGVIRGVIFDMDGVLVDSERLYLRFWREACAAAGFPLSEEQALSLRSNSPAAAIPKFEAWFGGSADYWQIRETRRRMMADYIDAHGVSAKEGAAALLSSLKEKDVPIALATASPVKRAKHYLAPLGLFDLFDAVVSGTDVTNGKPAPDIYLRAAGMLGIAPSACAAVEDSPSGIVSAHSAGCFTVMVPDLTPPQEDILPLVGCLAQKLTDLDSLL